MGVFGTFHVFAYVFHVLCKGNEFVVEVTRLSGDFDGIPCLVFSLPNGGNRPQRRQ